MATRLTDEQPFELCGAKSPAGGAECTLAQGHEGNHACLVWKGSVVSPDFDVLKGDEPTSDFRQHEHGRELERLRRFEDAVTELLGPPTTGSDEMIARLKALLEGPLAEVTKDRDRWVARMKLLEQRIADAQHALTGHAPPKARAPYPPEVMALLDALDHALARAVLNQSVALVPRSTLDAILDARSLLIGAKS